MKTASRSHKILMSRREERKIPRFELVLRRSVGNAQIACGIPFFIKEFQISGAGNDNGLKLAQKETRFFRRPYIFRRLGSFSVKTTV